MRVFGFAFDACYTEEVRLKPDPTYITFLMRTLMFLAAAAAVGANCSGRASAATAPSQLVQSRTIVAFGDSLTSGRGMSREEAYPAQLEKMLKAARLPFKVVNDGVSGDTTADAVRRLNTALDEDPAIMIVAFGANDGLRGVPVSQVRANLEKIIEAAQARHIEVLLCGMDALPILGWQYTVDFHQLYPALAARYNVPLVPFMLEGVLANQDMLLPDFIHPNATGAARIAQNIWPYLQPLALRLASVSHI
jgi:acyl-CoA thioesterase-1